MGPVVDLTHGLRLMAVAHHAAPKLAKAAHVARVAPHSVTLSSAAVWLLAVAGAIVPFVVGYSLGRRRRPASAGISPISIRVPDAGRASLVAACIRASDMVTSDAVRQVLADALAHAGVSEVDPTGQRFDPDLHCSAGIADTGDPGLDSVVASSERVGYEDRGRQLRPATVIVYTYSPSADRQRGEHPTALHS
jgi:hypothetical protein